MDGGDLLDSAEIKQALIGDTHELMLCFANVESGQIYAALGIPYPVLLYSN